MSKIIHRRDPAGITPSTVYDVEKNTNVLDWLNNTFKSQDDLCGDLACSFFLNQKEIFRSDHENIDQSRLDFTLGGNDQLVIVNRPAGIGIVVAIVIAVVGIAVSVISYMNMPKLPGEEDARNESPNNRLNAASNGFRPGQGIPECFGFGVSYPDFIQPSYYFYENNVKKVVGLYCISAGEVEVPEARVGDTDINDIPESSADVYIPYTKPDDEFLTIHQSATNVDGQSLVAPNDESVIQSSLQFTMTETSGVITVTVTDSVARDLTLSAGLYLYIRSTYTETIVPELPELPYDIEVYALDGVFEIISLDYVGVEAVITFSGSYSNISDVNGSLGRGYSEGVIGEGDDGELDTWIGWFDTPGEQAAEIFVHWQAPQGVRGSGGGTITLAVRFEIENVNTGQAFVKDDTLTKNTFDSQFVTTRFTKDEFPGMTVGQYKVRVKRITGVVSISGEASEQLKVEAYVSVTPYSVQDFGNVTTILLQRKATLFSPDQSSQKINVDYRRKLPFYDRGEDTYDENTLIATDSFADAAAYTLIVKGNETEETVNLAELYGVYDSLSYTQLGGFTFTFDDADLSKGERIESICNVARTVGFHDGMQWRFARDEEKPVRSAMFNRRSVTGNNAKQAWQPQRDDDADSVRIIYVDPVSSTEKYAERKFDTDTGEIISGEIGIIPIEIKLAGCKDDFQASNRADLEIRRIAHQRRSVREVTYRDALELDLLDRVGWVDINDIDTFDGEVMGFSDDTYDTTERFIPEDDREYVVFLTDEEGYPSNTVTCEARTDTEFGFIASGLSGAYVATGDQQVGSRYFIADSDDLESANFTLKARAPNPDGTVEIDLVEYKVEMYEKDGDSPPQDYPIISSGLSALNVSQDGNNSISVLTFETNGDISLNSKSSLWYSGGTTVDIGDSFEIYAELVSGDLTAGSLLSWVPLSSARAWTTFRSSVQGVGVSECVISYQIREINNTENNVTNQIGIQAAIASAVSLPATIEIEIEAATSTSQARLDFLSNGEWSGTDGDSGSYTTVVDLIGELYEIKATNLIGELDLGVVDTWIQLDDGSASFSVTSTETETATFDVELREIANPANTTISAITLSVTFPV